MNKEEIEKHVNRLKNEIEVRRKFWRNSGCYTREQLIETDISHKIALYDVFYRMIENWENALSVFYDMVNVEYITVERLIDNFIIENCGDFHYLNPLNEDGFEKLVLQWDDEFEPEEE